MESLRSTQHLFIRQRKEAVEILTGFETANKYEIDDDNGQTVGYAAEVSGGFLSRQFLKTMRPFTVQVTGPDGGNSLVVTRPFRFYFQEVTIQDAAGRIIGSVRREFSLLRRIYDVRDANGQSILQLFGPILKPWTFEIRQAEQTVGTIRKKWSGLLKEAFTSADNFGVEWPADLPLDQKMTLLGAVFLIDFAHFEQKSN